MMPIVRKIFFFVRNEYRYKVYKSAYIHNIVIYIIVFRLFIVILFILDIYLFTKI